MITKIHKKFEESRQALESACFFFNVSRYHHEDLKRQILKGHGISQNMLNSVVETVIRSTYHMALSDLLSFKKGLFSKKVCEECKKPSCEKGKGLIFLLYSYPNHLPFGDNNLDFGKFKTLKSEKDFEKLNKYMTNLYEDIKTLRDNLFMHPNENLETEKKKKAIKESKEKNLMNTEKNEKVIKESAKLMNCIGENLLKKDKVEYLDFPEGLMQTIKDLVDLRVFGSRENVNNYFKKLSDIKKRDKIKGNLTRDQKYNTIKAVYSRVKEKNPSFFFDIGIIFDETEFLSSEMKKALEKG